MLRFFVWWSGFFVVWGLFWSAVAVLDGDVFGVIFNLSCTAFQIYCFSLFRRRLREQRERWELELWEEEL